MNPIDRELKGINFEQKYPETFQKITKTNPEINLSPNAALDSFFFSLGINPVIIPYDDKNGFETGYLGEIRFLPANKLNQSVDEVIEVITDPKKYKLPEQALKEVFLKALNILESHLNLSTAQ
jgi:hypothetical protein